MTATAPATSAHEPSASDLYDPDEVFPQNSPLMQPHHPRLIPSPSPPPDVPLPKVSHPSKCGRNHKSSNSRKKIRPSQGDAVLIHYLDGGKRPEIADVARMQPLSQDPNGSDESRTGSELEAETSDESGDEEEVRSHEMSPVSLPPRHADPATATVSTPTPAPTATASRRSIDLKSLASTALAAVSAASHPDSSDQQPVDEDPRAAPKSNLQNGSTSNGIRDSVGTQEEDRSILGPPLSPYSRRESQDVYSPRQQVPGPVSIHSNDAQMSPATLSPTRPSELPPIQSSSPRSETSGHDPLPSIEHLLGPISPTQQDVERRGSLFGTSPPSGVPRIGGLTGSHGSPPISPHDPYFRQGLLSPASSMMSQQSHYLSSFNNAGPYRSGGDYIGNGDTPGTDVSSTAGTQGSITDRMSIDNMTNPPMGAFVCKFEGCTAPAFSTQYLLNSHANVHSSARPHYCPVKGCPRSVGGKGFKRKNEMIRHGLVHDSPGYVCPFCPDREHKYPRPDNLQRYAHAHT